MKVQTFLNPPSLPETTNPASPSSAAPDPETTPAFGALRSPEGPALLILPDREGHSYRHWQSHWQHLPRARTVALGDLDNPKMPALVAALDTAIRDSAREMVLVAHSLACLAVAWWSQIHWTPAIRHKIKGALLVAPPDADLAHGDTRLRSFQPIPRRILPFPSMLVASRDDPHMSFARSKQVARDWGSDLVDVGLCGHISASSGIGEWLPGLRLLATLTNEKPDRLIAELGLRRLLG